MSTWVNDETALGWRPYRRNRNACSGTWKFLPIFHNRAFAGGKTQKLPLRKLEERRKLLLRNSRLSSFLSCGEPDKNRASPKISFVEKKAQTRPYLRGRVCKLKGQRKTIPLIPPQRVSRLRLRELRLPPQRPCLLLLLQQSFLPRSF